MQVTDEPIEKKQRKKGHYIKIFQEAKISIKPNKTLTYYIAVTSLGTTNKKLVIRNKNN
jgi:hypothetical protein